MKRKCDVCGKTYNADKRNIKRGWGLCCSKSCAATKREMAKPGYNIQIVIANDFKRENWNNHHNDEDADALETLGMDFLLECGSRD